jgi:hypothetical protein
MEKYALLGYCGLYCGGCNSFEENSGKWKCKGCKDETVLISDCPTKECAEKKQLLYCGECEGFPCDAQNAFYPDGWAGKVAAGARERIHLPVRQEAIVVHQRMHARYGGNGTHTLNESVCFQLTI